jgi:hypothetical protein
MLPKHFKRFEKDLEDVCTSALVSKHSMPYTHNRGEAKRSTCLDSMRHTMLSRPLSRAHNTSTNTETNDVDLQSTQPRTHCERQTEDCVHNLAHIDPPALQLHFRRDSARTAFVVCFHSSCCTAASWSAPPANFAVQHDVECKHHLPSVSMR